MMALGLTTMFERFMVDLQKALLPPNPREVFAIHMMYTVGVTVVVR